MDREPGDRVGDTFGAGVAGPDAVTAVVVHGRAKVPTVDGVRGPGRTGSGLFMDQDFDARGSQGGPVEIKKTKDMGIGREVGVEAAGAE